MKDEPPVNKSTPEKRPMQFSVTQLMLYSIATAVCLLPVAWSGTDAMGLSIFLLFLVAALGTGISIGSIAKTLVGLALLGIAIGMLLPPIARYPVPASQRTFCLNNIRQLVLAMHNYHSANGHFPPAHTVDDQGNPLHSWRVLILPYLDENELYSKIDLTVPWDHPNNLAFHNQMPEIYHCLADPTNDGTTAYLMATGPNCFGNQAEERQFDDFLDGTSYTVAIIESTTKRTNWMSPNDISIEDLLKLQNQTDASTLITSNHPGGSNVGFADGSASFIDDTTTVNEWISLMHFSDEHTRHESE